MNDPARPSPLSYGAVWHDAGRMLAANAGLLTAIAGVFLFLPALVIARFAPPPEQVEGLVESLRTMQDYLGRAWLWLIGSALLNMIGVIAVYLMMLAKPRLTVGAAVMRALPILPFFYVVTLIQGLGAMLGFLALIIGMIFMLGKLVLAGPILIVEARAAPLTAVAESWRRSAGLGWAIGGLIFLLYVAASVIAFALRVGLGSMLLLLAGQQGFGGFLVDVLVAAVGAAVTVIATVLIAATYRAVSPRVELAKGLG